MTRQFMDQGATFSPCRRWRYRLWRVWNPSLPPMAAGMLNPSVADEQALDKTVSNQINRAIGSGRFGSLIVFNAFAYVTSYPTELKKQLALGFDIVGPENDIQTRSILMEVRDRNGLVSVGWGEDGTIAGRNEVIVGMARELGVELHSLGTTRKGYPRHPRGVSKAQDNVPWRWPPA